MAAVSADHAPAESVTSQALWRTATARVLASRGDQRAEGLIKAAIELVPPDLLNLRADLHVDLAEILATVGRRDMALSACRVAAEIYQRKGNVVGGRQAHAFEAQFESRRV
jgi:hypothetical protein